MFRLTLAALTALLVFVVYVWWACCAGPTPRRVQWWVLDPAVTGTPPREAR